MRPTTRNVHQNWDQLETPRKVHQNWDQQRVTFTKNETNNPQQSPKLRPKPNDNKQKFTNIETNNASRSPELRPTTRNVHQNWDQIETPRKVHQNWDQQRVTFTKMRPTTCNNHQETAIYWLPRVLGWSVDGQCAFCHKQNKHREQTTNGWQFLLYFCTQTKQARANHQCLTLETAIDWLPRVLVNQLTDSVLFVTNKKNIESKQVSALLLQSNKQARANHHCKKAFSWR
jgi:hypothetical protein